MQTTQIWTEKTEGGYVVTDGVWTSADYQTRYAARRVLADALWGERGADGYGTRAHLRVAR